MDTDPRPPTPADLTRLGRYRIVRPLSKGGMALVYEARRESLAGVQPRVAIKLILPEHEASETFKDLFVNEARLGASMHHQNLVQIQDFDCDADRYFLVMEYVEGLTLRRIITACQRSDTPIPVGVIAELGRQACDGLHYAHCAVDESGRHLRLVHRDMKPSNLILNPHGVVKVLDFGISKGRLREERAGSVKGTWGYMAPEQAEGQPVAPTADVFGLAVVLTELASMRPMFVDKGKDEIKRLLRDDHAARMAATLDPGYHALVPVLVRALQRDPKARFKNAAEFGRSLSALLPDPITARDEVVRFYGLIEALEAGDFVAAGPVISTEDHASLLMGAAPRHDDGGAGLVWTTILAGAATLLGVAATVLLIAVAIDGRQVAAPEAPPPVPMLNEVVGDEPPGPAGVGAPAEVREAAEPRAPHRTAAPPREGRVPAPPPSAPPDPPDEAEQVVIRVNRVDPPPPPVVRVVPVEPPAAAPRPLPPEPTEAELGTLIAGAKQPAEVYIQGQFVDMSPVKRELPAGRYTVSIVAADGRRASAVVDVKPGERIRKTWDFDRNAWR